jgi:hypothetical protein
METPISSGLTVPELRQVIRTGLESTPPGAASGLAWQMYLNLTVPTTDPYRQALQANYLAQTGHLLYIAQWSANPGPISDCSIDLDWDDQPDCVLASDDFIATFKMDGGRLLFAGSLIDGEFIQWIGPTSQFQIGAGEARDWMIRRGVAADPNEIPGAFAVVNAPFSGQIPSIQPGLLTFRSFDGVEKAYQLTVTGLRFSMHSAQPFNTHLPLAFAPQQFWQPGGPQRYFTLSSTDGQSLTLGLEDGPQLSIEILSTGARLDSFIDSVAFMGASENPDLAYPAGHFLPFPLAVFEIQSNGELQVEILHK